jgi:hypothetical protein
VIYFLRDPQSGLVKIGTSIRLSDRLLGLQAKKLRLKLLGVAEGGKKEERAIHNRFAYHRVKGEWFKPSRALFRYIKAESRPWDGTNEADTMKVVYLDARIAERAKIAAAMNGMKRFAYLNDRLSRIIEEDIKGAAVMPGHTVAAVAAAHLRETDNPSVMTGDALLLHEIARRAGVKEDGPATQSRVMNAIQRSNRGEFVLGYVWSGRKRRCFWLPEHAPDHFRRMSSLNGARPRSRRGSSILPVTPLPPPPPPTGLEER